MDVRASRAPGLDLCDQESLMGNENLKEKVAKSLESIRPALQFDGGDVELVEVDETDNSVTVRFQGACVGCLGAATTLENGIKQAILRHVPEVKEVRLVG